jgi:hypothetical protein
LPLIYYDKFFVGYQRLKMVSYTRDVLIKSIVAKEMASCTGEDYHKNLKELYHKWEHESSETLCKKYNQLTDTNITVDSLTP